ncbi:MAG TPA: hypothetical protein VHD83_21230 [Puia sp.]|nr:hypothetical protein [Puia sp.]
MNVPKLPKQTLGFFSISVAWMITMVILSYYEATYDSTLYLGALIIWSAILVFIAWLVFIITPLALLNHSGILFRIWVLPVVAGVYAVVVYSLLIVLIIHSMDVLRLLWIWALIIGVLFGLLYAMLISSGRVLRLLHRRPWFKLFSPLSPLVFSALFWWLFPTVAPRAAFGIMPRSIQTEIAVRTVKQFKKGDRFLDLKNSLPGYFKSRSAGNGEYIWSGRHWPFYRVEVKDDTIRNIENL